MLNAVLLAVIFNSCYFSFWVAQHLMAIILNGGVATIHEPNLPLARMEVILMMLVFSMSITAFIFVFRLISKRG